MREIPGHAGGKDNVGDRQPENIETKHRHRDRSHEAKIPSQAAASLPKQGDGSEPDIHERARILVLIQHSFPHHRVTRDSLQVNARQQIQAEVSFGSEETEQFPAEEITKGHRQRSQSEADRQTSSVRFASARLRKSRTILYSSC